MGMKKFKQRRGRTHSEKVDTADQGLLGDGGANGEEDKRYEMLHRRHRRSKEREWESMREDRLGVEEEEQETSEDRRAFMGVNS